MLVALAIGIENGLVKSTVRAIVHPQHNRHHGRAVREDVALQSLIDRSAAATGDPIAAPSGMNKLHVHLRKAGYDVGFGESRIQPLIGNAVAVEHNPVSIAK